MQGRLLDAVPLNTLTGVGAAQSSRLAKIGLHTVQDLLLHLPLRYEDRTHLYQIGELLPGVYATVEGEVLNCNITFGGRRMMTCQISDGSGILTMRFFNRLRCVSSPTRRWSCLKPALSPSCCRRSWRRG